LLPWAAGGLLSVLVLALTMADQSWLDGLRGVAPAVPQPAMVGPIAEAPVPEAAAAAPAPITEPVAAAPLAPRIVPISPDGRGTARPGARTVQPLEVAPAPRVAPLQPTAGGSRVLPISIERPQPAPPQGVQLVGAAAADAAGGVELIDFGRAPPASAPAAAEPDGIRVFIRYTKGRPGDAATVARLAEYLGRRGFQVAAIRPVGFQIRSADVRYFFDRDLAESQRLLGDLGWFFHGTPQRVPHEVRDFTHYTPRPRPGNVEIWLPGAS
jgi:hypothetical protein